MTTLTKSAMFNDLLCRGICVHEGLSVGRFFLIELYMPLRSVSLIQESCIYGLGFNSQTLNGSLSSFKQI